MTNKELRIGNFIYKQIPKKDTTLEVVEVLSIDGSFDVLDVKNSESYITEKCSLDGFNPIPLTDEWFIKWEFFKDGEYWSRGIDDYKFCFKYRDWAKNWAFYQEFTDSPYPEDDGKKYPISFDIEYVHQLQNLWFALLHKEIKENED